MMKPVLIIKTGQTVEKIPASRGDFEHWIMSGMERPESNFVVSKVYQNEALPEAASVAGIIVTGSPAMVTDKEDWSELSAAYLREAVQFGIPVMGICYGHQLLAHALGGIVDYNPKGREIGTTKIKLRKAAMEDALFKGLPEQILVQVSHSQSVITLPEGSDILASNEVDPHQAVRFADKAWGVQFHPEFDDEVMTYYLEQRAEALDSEGICVQELLAGVKESQMAWELLSRFDAIIQAHNQEV